MLKIRRREFIQLAAATCCLNAVGVGHQREPIEDHIIIEKQKGDPDVPYEQVAYDTEKIQAMVERPASKANFEPWDPNMPRKISAAAVDFLGLCRETSQTQISEFLQLFDLPFRDSHGYVAFCAAGLSYCALLSYVQVLNKPLSSNTKITTLREYMPDFEHYFFYPTVSCLDMYYAAAAKHRWIERRDHPDISPENGWIVLYDWSGHSSTPDHCGIVTRADASGFHAIEFNTSGKAGGSERNGGTVTEKTRSYDYVKGFIRSPKSS
jgi:hypothetical protein